MDILLMLLPLVRRHLQSFEHGTTGDFPPEVLRLVSQISQQRGELVNQASVDMSQ